MEYGECSLYDIIKLKYKIKEPFSEKDIPTFLFQITKILSDLKINNIFQRGIKPHNILIDKEGK